MPDRGWPGGLDAQEVSDDAKTMTEVVKRDRKKTFAYSLRLVRNRTEKVVLARLERETSCVAQALLVNK